MIFEGYIKLLESFKQHQISKLLERIDAKIFDILYSKHVSLRILPYFPRYELCLKPHDTELEPGTIYISEKNGKIAYSVINPDNTPVKDVVLEELDAPSPFIYSLALKDEGGKLAKGKFYVRMVKEGLEYTVLDPNGKLVTDIIKKEELKIDLGPGFSLKALESLMPEILRITSQRNHTLPFILESFRGRILSAISRKGHIKWSPFTNYDLDPDNISQIKKLITALYYARLTFIDLENVDVRNIKRSVTDVKLLYSKTIDLAYEASYLLTHLDVDLRDMFKEELSLILPILSQIQDYAEKHAKEKKAIVKALDPLPLAYNAGEIAGITVDQMRPIGGDVDFNFLTQFSAVLPSYIDQLTHYIEQFSSEIKESEPKLNQEKLDELQNAALNLLNQIENLKGNSFFVSLKFLNYIHIIRNVITLSMSSLEQIGELTDSSQDLMREKLSLLKYEVLPALFSLVDKIEDNAMLKPGTLSVPLMEKVKVLYEKILYLPKKAIDFKAKGEELLEIEDSRFIELRLEMTYHRIDNANKTLYRIKKTIDGSKRFFEILNDPRYNKLCLYQFPPEVKGELTELYKLLKPYMAKLDINLNELIISRLTGPEDWYSYMGRPIRFVTRKLPADHVSFVLAKEQALKDLITKDQNSQLFHINLNKDLIDSVHKKANLALFPYSEKTNVYALDESLPLQVEQDKDRKSRLSKAEFQQVQKAYLRFAQIVKEQIAQHPDLYGKKLELFNLDDEVREECHQLFKIFQPYLTSIISPQLNDAAKKKVFQPYLSSILSPEIKNSAISLEHYLSNFFARKVITSTPSTDLFLNLDKNIQGFFDHINYEWFNKNEFQQILIAYKRFSEIIKKQIETKHQLYGNQLILTTIDEEAKKECSKLYPIFKPYLKFAIPTELSDSAQNFEKFLSGLLANEPIEILEAPPSSLFVQWDKHIQDFLAKWEDKSDTYYNIAKANFLDKNESQTLSDKRAEDAKLYFKTEDGNKSLFNTERLNLYQTLEVYQWYQNKLNKFLVVRNAYLQFITLLRKEIEKRPQIQGNILLLNQLDPEVKNQCRNFYSIFQPYFICAVPSEMKEAALQFDKYLVAVLSNRNVDEKDAPSVQMFLDLYEHFQDYFSGIRVELNRRVSIFEKMAKEKFFSETSSAKLQTDPKTGREHYVLKHTNYSKCIHEFRQSLFEVTKIFNKTMQKELFPCKSLSPSNVIDLSPTTLLKDIVQTVRPPSAVPFPEMEDNNKRLAQSKQVCALKDIFNSMFHLEGIVLELENLNNQSAKSFYVGYLLQAYGHLNEIIKSAQRLASDPHLGFIARDLLDKAQNLYATFQEHSDAYQVGVEEVPYGTKNVQYNPLWYVLNAFYIGPKHIRALKNTNYLTTDELNDLHLRAKKATLIIENLINSSDSYFKLFLQTPNMIYLYQELTTKLNEFTTTAHDGAIDNLEKIRSSVFTPILLEADRWENKLGLAPGLLSGPLRQITDEFFKGLLHPLELNSNTYIKLVFDKAPLEERIALTKKQIKTIKKALRKTEKDYKDIENLYYWYLQVTSPQEIFDLSVIRSKVSLNQAKMELTAAYKEALPKLAKLKKVKKIEIAPSQYPEDHKLDALCNSGLKAYDPHFTEIEALIVASHHFYLGVKATHQMRLDTAGEKLNYLNSLDPLQATEKVSFIDKYTTESFDKHLEVMCNRYLGLQYSDEEYRVKLKAYLLKLKTEIITQSKTVEDIDANIKKRLQAEISKFERKFYAEYYHLDAVLIALAQFKIYFKNARTAIDNHSSLFESEQTLDEKSKYIRKLEGIAIDKTLDVQKRIDQIKVQTKNPNFSIIILKSKKVDTFNFAYLKLCFLWLLEALHLYTPKRQILLENIKSAVENPPKVSELTNRFGLFTSTPPTKGAIKNEAPTMPIATPSV